MTLGRVCAFEDGGDLGRWIAERSALGELYRRVGAASDDLSRLCCRVVAREVGRERLKFFFRETGCVEVGVVRRLLGAGGLSEVRESGRTELTQRRRVRDGNGPELRALQVEGLTRQVYCTKDRDKHIL